MGPIVSVLSRHPWAIIHNRGIADRHASDLDARVAADIQKASKVIRTANMTIESATRCISAVEAACTELFDHPICVRHEVRRQLNADFTGGSTIGISPGDPPMMILTANRASWR